MGGLSDASEVTAVVDYCGAGGESQGLVEAGIKVIQAANHFDKAIETHAANHRTTDHLLTDLLVMNPRKRPRAHIYQASPECTWHSPAGGRKRHRAMLDMFDDYVPDAAGVRSRATMLTVLATAEAKRYPIVIVENVTEVADWEMFDVWLAGFSALGYEHQILSVSAAHIWSERNAPAPQWRDRVYFVFYLRGIEFPDVSPRPWAQCDECGAMVQSMQAWKRPDRRRIGKYGKQYVYVCPVAGHGRVEPLVAPAMDALDLADLGTRIGDRKRPMALSTLRRGYVGWLALQQEALLVKHRGQTYDAASSGHPKFGDANAYYRVQGIDEPMTTRTSEPGDMFMMSVNHGGRDPRQFNPATRPLPTRSTKLGDAVVTPFLTVLRNHSQPIPIDAAPTQTISAGGNHHALTIPDEPFVTRHYTQRGQNEPFVTRNYNPRGSKTAHLSTSIYEPLHVITASGGNRSLVTPRPGKRLTLSPVDWDAIDLHAEMADWQFRMLSWREHANAQRFPRDYIFTGNSGVNTLLAGNAVASNVACYLGLLARVALKDTTLEGVGLAVAA